MMYMGVKYGYEHYLNKLSSILVSHFKFCFIDSVLQRLGKLSPVGNDIYEHLVQPWSESTVSVSHEVCESSVT